MAELALGVRSVNLSEGDFDWWVTHKASDRTSLKDVQGVPALVHG